ncbi:MAG TPA: FHA domain-containing protein [Gemmatales bacterium]|nr:FHA domain-containing protein [Gemmatales bacterium]
MSTTAAPPTRADTLPSLLILTGPNTGRKLVMNRSSLLFGSHAACDVKITGDGIAEMHCLIVQTPKGLLIRDCKSQTGTLLNGMAVAETALRDNDTLQIGTFQFKAQLPEPSATDTVKRAAPPVATSPPAASPVLSDGAAQKLQRLARSRQRLAKFAWKRRTQSLVQSRRVAELERRLQVLEESDDDDNKLELHAMEMRLESLRRELERRETALRDGEHELSVKMTEIQRQQERYSSGNRQAPQVELANARRELERVKQHLKKLADEEASLLENMSTFRKIEAEERTKLEHVQAQLTRQQARLTPDDLAIEQHADYYRQQVLYLQHELQVVQQELARRQAQIDEKARALQDIEDDLNRSRAERERENEAWEAERTVQLEAFNRQRAEAKEFAEERKQFMSERAKQIEELAHKQLELDKKQATFAEMEAGISRQRKAVQEETETWIEQRQAYLSEMAERQQEIETIRVHLQELKAEEQKLMLSNAEWLEHADKERERLKEELESIRANAVKEAQAEMEANLALLRQKREDLEDGLRQFRSQAEQLWEGFLNALRVEATGLLNDLDLPK